MCVSAERALLYEGLTDRVFFCAPGTWTLFRCASCRCAFLDPRPTPETIGRAYSNYFTHAAQGENGKRKMPFKRWLQRALANGYRNYRFGTHLKPSSYFGVLMAYLLPSKRAVLDAERRHLFPTRSGERLLDVGCGNGAFLDLAQRIGWRTVGIDFDPEAVKTARSLGLDVRLGGIDVLNPALEQFDGITLSHVIEHVHTLTELLRACYRLLKPGGWIWVETPNLDAIGHELFRRNWLHLDPPRHLVLFTRAALLQALVNAGFTYAEDQPYRPQYAPSFGASEFIAKGLNPIPPPTPSDDTRKIIRRAETVARHDFIKRECITLKAQKLVSAQQSKPRSAAEAL